MKDLQLFNFQDIELRVFNVNGEIHFAASDVCKLLGIKNSRDALARLDSDEKDVVLTDTPGGEQEISTVNESGFYTLVLSSRKEIAKPVKRWVTHDVLPQIRKTGKYELASPSKRLSQQVTEMEATASIFKSFHTIGTLAGFKGNQLTLLANLATRKLTWIDSLELMELTNLPVEVQEALLIPKQIGERLGGLSSIKVNKMLEELGLQVQTSYVGKGNVIKKFWELTEAGKKYGIYVDTSRKSTDGIPRSIKWYESVIELLKGKAQQ